MSRRKQWTSLGLQNLITKIRSINSWDRALDLRIGKFFYGKRMRSDGRVKTTCNHTFTVPHYTESIEARRRIMTRLRRLKVAAIASEKGAPAWEAQISL